MRFRAGHDRILALAAIVVTGAACVAPVPPSRAPGPPSAAPGPPTAPPTPTASPASPAAVEASPPASAALDPSPTPLPPVDPFSGPFAPYTIVCRAWDGEEPPQAVACGTAAGLALAAIGADRAASVRRLDVGFGDPCPPGTPCPAIRPDVRWVAARSAGFDSLLVRVARTADDNLAVWPPVDGPTMPPPAFAPPPSRAPDVGADAPAALRAREPLAFCGTETLTGPDAFDAGARRCFLDGVAAWVPVELVSIDSAAEAGVVTTVLRWAGRGAVQRFVRSGGAWTAADCALSPVPTPARFVIVAPCEPRTLPP